MNVLVLGATGDQGRPQVEHALALGHAVRAAMRDPARNRAMFDSRAECVGVDYADQPTLDAAMREIDVVLGNYPSSSFNEGGPLIEAARATGRAAHHAGAGLIVFNTSLPVGASRRGFAAQDIRFDMRAALVASGVPVISIEPVVYIDNLLRGWVYPQIAEHDRFVYPHRSDLEVSWLCLHDLAKLMLAAAARPQLAGRCLAVGGPEALRGPQVARFLSLAAGRTIEFVSQPVEEFCGNLRARMRVRDAETLDRMMLELKRIYRWYNESPERPFRVDMGPVLAQLPVQLTTVRDWTRSHAWSIGR